MAGLHYRGVLFDFNGTLLYDSDKHKRAWQLFLGERLGVTITEDEVRKNCLGQSNFEILPRYFGASLTREELTQLALEKEAVYRRLCLAEEESFQLVEGAVAYFEHLKELNIPFTIATGSEISNVRFYFEKFELGKWFAFDRVVFDDGSMPGKPAPDVYLRAADKLGLSATACLVFEDSRSGVQAAKNANVYAVVQLLEKPGDPLYEGTALTVQDFTDVAVFDAL